MFVAPTSSCAVLPYSFREWELLAFLNFLIPAPALKRTCRRASGSIDMDSYRVGSGTNRYFSCRRGPRSAVPLGGGGGKPSRRSPAEQHRQGVQRPMGQHLERRRQGAEGNHGRFPRRCRRKRTERAQTPDKQAARLERWGPCPSYDRSVGGSHRAVQTVCLTPSSKWLKDTVFNMTYEDDVA